MHQQVDDAREPRTQSSLAKPENWTSMVWSTPQIGRPAGREHDVARRAPCLVSVLGRAWPDRNPPTEAGSTLDSEMLLPPLESGGNGETNLANQSWVKLLV